MTLGFSDHCSVTVDDTVLGGAVGYTAPPQTMLPSNGSQQHSEGSSEWKEIRRRRLERFSNDAQHQENSTNSNRGGTPD